MKTFVTTLLKHVHPHPDLDTPLMTTKEFMAHKQWSRDYINRLRRQKKLINHGTNNAPRYDPLQPIEENGHHVVAYP